MAEWSLPDLDCPINHLDSFRYATYPSCRPREPAALLPHLPHCPAPQAHPGLPAPAANMSLHFASQLQYGNSAAEVPRGENPREVRNRAEKMRRDRLNEAVAELASMVPPVVAARRKIDKTTVLRLTAHYLRAHQYVFGDSIDHPVQHFNPASIHRVLSLFNGFLITTTYRGIIVVVSPNVNQYLGYTELDLLGQNLFTITHEGDRAMLRDHLMPRTQNLGPNGELVIPDEPDGARRVGEQLASEKRRFIIRLKKLGQRSEPSQYVTCHVEGSLRKSDRACRTNSRCCQIVRRARARSENPCSSGNDIVFVGIVRPTSETFINESAIESYRMEYRTRHSIDGEIIQCESRIALVTGYMTQEVSGVNAMNFMHRDDVRWVIIALREMYDQHRLFGESCYRLITKNGQSIYMRTRGCLDVDRDSRAVTSFVCTNTVVSEEEGKKLIKLMKRKFSLLVNNNNTPAIEDIDDDAHDDEQNEDQPVPVEDPRRLEEVILHLVTNLPSPSSQESEEEAAASTSPERKSMSPHRLTIIPPNKERIVSAIEKIYGVIKTFPKDTYEENNYEQSGRSSLTPKYRTNKNAIEMNSIPAQETQIVPYKSRHVSSYVAAADGYIAEPVTYNVPDNVSEYNSDSILNTMASPDLGYFDASSSPFSNIPSIFANYNQNGDEMFQETQPVEIQEVDYNGVESSMPMPQYADKTSLYKPQPSASSFKCGIEQPQASTSNYTCGVKQPQPSTSNVTCGVKRPNQFEDFRMVYKKKITELEYARPHKSNSNVDVSPLDVLFDESVFNIDEIDAAVKALECSDLPFTPDLLISSEVQEILNQLEKEVTEEKLDFNLSDYK